MGVTLRSAWWAISVLALVALYVVHAISVLPYLHDIPFWDDWVLIPPEQQDLLSWLGAVHLDHRLVFTRLVIGALYWHGGWNIETHLQLNWALYTASLLALLAFCALTICSANVSVFPPPRRWSGSSGSLSPIFSASVSASTRVAEWSTSLLQPRSSLGPFYWAFVSFTGEWRQRPSAC